MATTDLRVERAGKIEIRPVEGADLLEIPPLSARCFGFAEVDQIPPWVMRTMVWVGGLALGAFHQGRLVGYSIFSPGYEDGERFLDCVALAVDPAFESRGVATALQLRHRELALEAGYRLLKWTTASVASGPLYVYLTKLGARLTALLPDMFASMRMPFPDEVEVRWELDGPARRTEHASEVRELTRTSQGEDGLRRLVAADDGVEPAGHEAVYLVEIPWDGAALLEADPSAAAEWCRGVRGSMQGLLGGGYVGTEVRTDRAERRAWVQFERAGALG